MQALEGGIASGGEMGPVHSAALLVADKMPFALVDLRVDWHDENPVAQLRNLWTAWPLLTRFGALAPGTTW